jgi:hypothetical protein
VVRIGWVHRRQRMREQVLAYCPRVNAGQLADEVVD